MATFHLFSFGVFVHIIFLFAVFDIYFKSTVIVGLSPINNSIPAVGKRVVLISVDGLRLDALYDKESGRVADIMPHVKRTLMHRGTWGISESRVPTESRPGHVAMLAGFYEDPSAVTKGWKENPVTFDSIFNETTCSFAWGSPDILNVFFKGLSRDCAFSFMYENEQNFAGDTMEYDNWVHRQLKRFLEKSKGTNKDLHRSGVFFFLHLLGQDTSGHTHKPHTEKYAENLRNVDRLTAEFERMFDEFYGDNLTSFIFTSDHGMTDWGSHGAGHPDETDTPFIAWGAGLNKPSSSSSSSSSPQNIKQADITPLVAVLLGCPIPVNSVGWIPLAYLDASASQKAEAALLNAKQITAQFRRNLQIVQSQIIPFFHSPFEKLTNEELELMLGSISKQIENKQYADAVEKSKVLMEIGLEGLDYYQNYYQRLLLVSVSSSYILWICYLTLELFDPSKGVVHVGSRLPSSMVLAISGAVTLSLILIQGLPLSYAFYFLLPQLLLYLLVNKLRKTLVFGRRYRSGLIPSSLAIVAGVEVIVFSFFERWLLCASLVLSLLWSASAMDSRRGSRSMTVVWIVTGAALSGFCLLPTVGGQPDVVMIVVSGFVLFVLLLLTFLFGAHRENVVLFCVRCLAVAAAAWNNAIVHATFGDEGELSKTNQFFSWSLCLFAFSLLMIGRSAILERLDQVYMSFLVPFLLMSISHEGLFMAFLFVHLRCWIYIECENFGRRDGDKPRKSATFTDFRRAFFFLLYIWVGFFGLGNVASLNSFDPAWVRSFLTVFSPFTMSALILFKALIPFLTVACSMRALTVILELKPERLFVIVLIYCNLMGLNFLYLVRNKGSWLDIGTSISHYVIQQFSVVFLLALYATAKFLLSPSLRFAPEFGKLEANGKSRSLDSPGGFLSLPSYYSNYNKLHRS